MPRPKGGSKKIDYASVGNILLPYRRVSTREQAISGAGLGAQSTAITYGLAMRDATALHWDCVDEGKSGKNMQREGLDEALATIRRGEASGLIVSKLDRLSRSLLDFALLTATAAKEGWNIIALDVGLDLATPAGQMMAGILAVFAQFERDVISQRTKDGLAEKRAAGVRLGRPRSLDDELLAKVVGMYGEVGNYSAVARMLNEAGCAPATTGKQWYPSTVQKAVLSQDGQKLIKELTHE